jgi:hypothetical protein
MTYRSNSLPKLRSEASLPQQQFRPKARDVLVSWARAREYLDRATGYLKLAHATPDPAVRDRFIAIAQHYRALAVAEQSIADQIRIEQRSPHGTCISKQTNIAALLEF